MRGSGRMEILNRILIRHGRLLRLAWMAMALLLAACNNPNDGGGGGDPGGDPGGDDPGY